MTEFLDINGGRIAYDSIGEGPLVVMSHGIGDRRQAFRYLAPLVAQAGYRVVTADMRGHGDSSMGWTSHDGTDAISRTDVAGDLVELIRHLGGPAVIIGHSLSGGAATIAAATAPDLVCGIAEINPFTMTQKLSVRGLLSNRRYRRGLTRLLGSQLLRSLNLWMRYLDVAYPAKPADYAEYMAALRAKLTEPGRMAEFIKTGKSTPADAQAKLPDVRCRALIIMGGSDPDFADPKAEGERIVAALPAGLGSAAVIGGAGHYPHAQCAHEVAELLIPFLKSLGRPARGPATPLRNSAGG
jgi:pimeloyl-ACP methyl ester carboxylesterase